MIITEDRPSYFDQDCTYELGTAQHLTSNAPKTRQAHIFTLLCLHFPTIENFISDKVLFAGAALGGKHKRYDKLKEKHWIGCFLVGFD